jgi:hypothetical protein
VAGGLAGARRRRQAGIGFRWLERQRNAGYVETFIFPWSEYRHLQWPILRRDDPRLQRGRVIVEAQYRADAAIALERIGATEAAAAEWARKRAPAVLVDRALS